MSPIRTEPQRRLRFGEWLVQHAVVTDRVVEQALMDQRQRGGRLGEVLHRLAAVSEHQVTDALARFLEIPCWSADELSNVDLRLALGLPERVARRYRFIPVSRLSSDDILVAMVDPLDVVARDTASRLLGARVQIAICSVQDLDKAIARIYHGSHVQEQRIKDLVEVMVAESDRQATEPADNPEGASVTEETQANHAPVVRFVDLLLSQAVQSRASDIHLEPQEESMVIRMRVDGILREMIPPPRKMQAAVVSRVKILSGMNIAERRLPQDGRLKIMAPGRPIDVRVSVIPTIYGEKVVMRILDKEAVNHDIDLLGFEPELLRIFKGAISKPHGIVIVTGPTGSGKSTTLYSALNYLKNSSTNITTVEDPVEYRLAGINQIQTKPEIGLTFARCLRSILRQDPDIVLVGEIRDRETMEIAIQASLTGHLVLTTFHTNDAVSALSRFVYMGLERYLLASTVNLVTAQRLLRRICEHCKEPIDLDRGMLRGLRISEEALDQATFMRGRGCSACGGTGFSGRVPIFEFLPMDDQIRTMVINDSSEMEIRSAARVKGYGSLAESGFRRLCAGITTLEEVLRVAYVEQTNQALGS